METQQLHSTTPPINILLADDHPLVQDGIRTRFDAFDDIHVVGTAKDGEELLSKAQELNPDVVITDISMPKINGLKATHLLSQKQPKIKVLILTMHDNKEYMQNALESGAKGYILKDQPANEMIDAVRAVYKGEHHFCSQAKKLHKQNKNKVASNQLTAREKAVLLELLNGNKNKFISEKFNISVRTVETHRSNIYRKLDTHSIAGLIRYAKKVGYI